MILKRLVKNYVREFFFYSFFVIGILFILIEGKITGGALGIGALSQSFSTLTGVIFILISILIKKYYPKRPNFKSLEERMYNESNMNSFENVEEGVKKAGKWNLFTVLHGNEPGAYYIVVPSKKEAADFASYLGGQKIKPIWQPNYIDHRLKDKFSKSEYRSIDKSKVETFIKDNIKLFPKRNLKKRGYAEGEHSTQYGIDWNVETYYDNKHADAGINYKHYNVIKRGINLHILIKKD